MSVFELHKKLLGELEKPGAAPARAYVVAGPDEFLVGRFCREIADALKKAMPAAGFERIESDKDPINDILFSDGLFASEKIVWIKNGEDFFAKSAKNAAVLEAFFATPSESVFLVAGSTEADAKNPCTAWAKKNAVFLAVPALNLEKYQERESFFQDISRYVLAPAGKKMARASFEALIEKTGSDARQILGELEKLVVYAGTRQEISAKDVEDLVGVSAEKKFYNFTQAVGDRDCVLAISIWNRLRQQGEGALFLVRSLSGHFRMLLIARSLFGHLNRGLANSTQAFFTKLDRIKAAPPEDAGGESDAFLKMHPYRIFHLFKQCLRFEERELAEKLLLLKESETSVKACSFADQAFMENLIVRLTRQEQ